jgi:hypothetical protein
MDFDGIKTTSERAGYGTFWTESSDQTPYRLPRSWDLVTKSSKGSVWQTHEMVWNSVVGLVDAACLTGGCLADTDSCSRHRHGRGRSVYLAKH